MSGHVVPWRSIVEKSTVPADPSLRGVVGERRASPRQRAEGAAGCNSVEQTLICLLLLICLITSPVAATRLRGDAHASITRPWTTHGGKMVHASGQKPGDPNTKRDKTWGAHERLAVRRATTAEGDG